MSDSVIYHVVTQESWEAQSTNDFYHHASLDSEGFIHCSDKGQVEGVLERYFQGIDNLLLLTIDKSRIKPKLVYEKSTDGVDFPHLYGQLNKDAIIKIENI